MRLPPTPISTSTQDPDTIAHHYRTAVAEVGRERGHEDELDKKFASLLKKEEGKTPTKPDWRDIDFD